MKRRIRTVSLADCITRAPKRRNSYEGIAIGPSRAHVPKMHDGQPRSKNERESNLALRHHSLLWSCAPDFLVFPYASIFLSLSLTWWQPGFISGKIALHPTHHLTPFDHENCGNRFGGSNENPDAPGFPVFFEITFCFFFFWALRFGKCNETEFDTYDRKVVTDCLSTTQSFLQFSSSKKKTTMKKKSQNRAKRGSGKWIREDSRSTCDCAIFPVISRHMPTSFNPRSTCRKYMTKRLWMNESVVKWLSCEWTYHV